MGQSYQSSSMVQPASSVQAGVPGAVGVPGLVPTASVLPPKKQRDSKLPWIIGTVVAALIAVTFIGLFIYIFNEWNTVKTDVDGQITAAVATAVNNKTEELEAQFEEREKLPYRLFAGPADYGELSFDFPKTWSVYEADDAVEGGDYVAYLNPDKVYPVSDSNINALRVLIKDQAYDSYVKQYDSYVSNGRLSVSVRPINGENANLYTGELPGTDKLQGTAAVFKLRDKTVVLQTESEVFYNDFYKILDSVRYNQ